jgi:hypothetical protein
VVNHCAVDAFNGEQRNAFADEGAVVDMRVMRGEQESAADWTPDHLHGLAELAMLDDNGRNVDVYVELHAAT